MAFTIRQRILIDLSTINKNPMTVYQALEHDKLTQNKIIN